MRAKEEKLRHTQQRVPGLAYLVDDEYEEDGTDGVIMSFQEPGGEQAELGIGYVAYNEAGRKQIEPVAELTGAPLDDEGVSVLFGSE